MDEIEILLLKALDLHRAGKLPAEKDIRSSLVGIMGESKVIELTEGVACNKGGFDVLGKKNFVGNIEVKTAHKPTNGVLGAWSLLGKRGKCDYVCLVDAQDIKHDKYRVSMIPHDKFFAFMDIPNRNGNYRDSFTWSASYNMTDKLQEEATKLFLKHEIIC